MIPDFSTIYRPRIMALLEIQKERVELMEKIDAIWQSNPINLYSLCSFPNLTTVVSQDYSKDKKIFSEGLLLYNAAKDQAPIDIEQKKLAGWIAGCNYGCYLIEELQQDQFSEKIEKNLVNLEEDVQRKAEFLMDYLNTLYKNPEYFRTLGASWCNRFSDAIFAYFNATKTHKKVSRDLSAIFLHISQLFKDECNFKQSEMFDQLREKYQEREGLYKGDHLLNRHFKYSRFYSRVLDKRPNDFHILFAGGDKKKTLKEVALHLKLFVAEHGHLLTFEEQERLHKCRHELLQAIEMQSVSPFDIASKIASMAPGESLMMNVVTATPHLAFYKIERIDKDDYLFTLINTGYDEVDAYHRQPPGNVFSDTQLYAHKAWRIPQRALSEQSCIGLFGPETAKRDLLEIISAIDHYFLEADMGGQRELGRLHHSQRHGSCASKAVTSYVHEGLGQPLYERFKAYRTKQLIEKFHTWEKSLPLEKREDLYQQWTDSKRAIEERDALLAQTLSRQEVKAEKRWQTASYTN